MLEACGLRVIASAGRRSRRSTPTSSRTPAARRTADAVALMAEARRRAHEQFGVELEHEVEFLGALELPPLGVSVAAPASGESRLWPPSVDRARAGRRERARRVASCRRAPRPAARPARFVPSAARSSSAWRSSSLPSARTRRPRDLDCSRSSGSRSPAEPPAVRRQVRRALAPLVGTSLLALDGAALERASRRSRRSSRPATTARFRTRFASTSFPRAPVAVLRSRHRDRGSSPRAVAVVRPRPRRHDPGASAHLAAPRDGRRGRRDSVDPRDAETPPARSHSPLGPASRRGSRRRR